MATDDTFTAEVEQQQSGLIIVDFWAEWCGPCKQIAPVLDQLLEEYGDRGLKVVKVDVDANTNVSMRYNVRSIPMLLFFKGGKLVDSVVGSVPKPHLVGKIAQHI